MLIRVKRDWDIPEREATPEAAFLDRRALMRAGAIAGATTLLPAGARADTDPSASLYPAKHNDAYKIDRALTPEKINAQYNNFYEFGTSKSIAAAAASLKTRPWSVAVDGLCNAPKTYAIDDLLKAVTLEERLYRHRCVEAWSMTIPWTGFPLSALVALADPKPEAKYIRFETFQDPKMAFGQKASVFPWPYVEGLTMAEATSELPLMVTGAYGKPLANSFGAPIRLALPWKYGFKSIKSITKISFVAERPLSFWQQLAEDEYGFWANVNPEVPHPRWSQATEEVLGTGKRVPTQLFNGYGAQVAALYKDLQSERLYV